jgi:uncharacterized protein involved in copper resistance
MRFKLPPSASAIARLIWIFGFSAMRPLSAQSSIPDAPTPASHADWPPAVKDNMVFKHVLFDELEARTLGSSTEMRWDAQGRGGTDMNKLWIKSEGFAGNGSVSDGDHEVLYDRPIPRTRYFDAQAGVRADVDSDPSRVWAAIGVEGMVPYFFDLEPTFYIRNGGNIAGRINGSWDLFITQRLETYSRGKARIRANPEWQLVRRTAAPRSAGIYTRQRCGDLRCICVATARWRMISPQRLSCAFGRRAVAFGNSR